MPISLFVLILFAGETPAGPPPFLAPGEVPPVAAPYWAQSPSVEDMARVYPDEARAQGLGGRAMLDCGFLPSGQTTDCKVVQESPEGQGFGAAALSLAPPIVMGQTTRSTPRFAGGRARIPFVWRMAACPALLSPAADSAPPATVEVRSWSMPSPLITRPDWVRKPSSDDMARFYPDRASRNGIHGKTAMTCRVTSRGSLTACEIVSETPEGEDFGAATLKVADKFRMRPMTDDCVSVEGATVRIPLIWSPSE